MADKPAIERLKEFVERVHDAVGDEPLMGKGDYLTPTSITEARQLSEQVEQQLAAQAEEIAGLREDREALADSLHDLMTLDMSPSFDAKGSGALRKRKLYNDARAKVRSVLDAARQSGGGEEPE